jgi:SP family facilitated glucose transporter-like MFS transporter 8
MNNHLSYNSCIFLVSDCLQIFNIMLQVLATSAKNMVLLGWGMTLGFPTIVIPSLLPHHGNMTDPREDTLTLSEEQISWFSK